MQDHSPARRFPFSLDLVLRRGLGRTLLLCFLALAMLPMALMGAISYRMAANHLTQEVRQKIGIAAELKSDQIQALFDNRPTQTPGPINPPPPPFSTPSTSY